MMPPLYLEFLRNRKVNEFWGKAGFLNMQSSDTNRKREATRASTSRVEVKDVIFVFCQRTMGMAINDCRKFRRRRIEIKVF